MCSLLSSKIASELMCWKLFHSHSSNMLFSFRSCGFCKCVWKLPQGLGYTLVSMDLELSDKLKHVSTSWLLCWFSCLVSWAIANLHGKISSLFQAQHAQLKKCCLGTLTEALGKWFLPWARYWLISSSLLRPSPCPALSWLLRFSGNAARRKHVKVIITGCGQKCFHFFR